MRYVSLFSGIEAASVAWRPLGWEPVAFAEVDEFCCELLAKRYPDVPNLGDVSNIDWSSYAGAVDLIVGGSPCQAFSVAGNRKGLMDDRSALMLEYIRAVREVRPRWLLWENVPGVLSQSDGDAFDTLLGELEQCGYSLAWRVLDAQFFGVAQRRRRVFVVGHSSAGCAAAVLFERESLRWDYPSSRAKRQAITADAGSRPCVSFAQNSRNELRIIGDGSLSGALCSNVGMKQRTYIAFSAGQSKGAGSAAAAVEIAPTLRASSSGTNQVPTICMTDTQSSTAIESDVCGTISVHSAKDAPVVASDSVIAFQPKASASQGLSVGETSPTLGTTKTPAVVTSSGDDLVGSLCARDYKGVGSQSVGEGKVLSDGSQVRRLTPVECERLQGFPDNYTKLGDTKDTPRYKALGNSMAVPVMRWIGRRMEQVDKLASAYQDPGARLGTNARD